MGSGSKQTASWEVPYLRGALGLSIWSGFPPRTARGITPSTVGFEIGGARPLAGLRLRYRSGKVVRFRGANRGHGGSDQQSGDQAGFHGVAAELNGFEIALARH